MISGRSPSFGGKGTGPFGSECGADGTVRFRLWAPAAEEVELGLTAADGERCLPMTSLGDGWFEVVTATARPGSLYRFRADGGPWFPDPASRFNPQDVHGPSEVIDPAAYCWDDGDWYGRPWEEAVIYELHVGTFTPEGSFRAVIERLDYLRELGVTALELMPVADFPGLRNWGYDGVLPFAPDASYGRPEDLKVLVDAAHAKGLMVFLDVVYNHFGPEGNYLHRYAPAFFSARHHTPWGAAINFDGEDSRTVRDFFIQNALYWLTEYHCDGLRLDAVDAIRDDSAPHILEELAEAVRAGPGRQRHIHLVLENDANQARMLARDDGRPRWFTAQWNDDFHHACHVLLTGEADGYYADCAAAPERHLARCLAEGFAWQGEPSAYRHGQPRGEPSGWLPPQAFVAFLQTHDQVGNRAFGERLAALTDPRRLRAATTALLLCPQPPLLFMGEEFAAATPFRFFCDFAGELGAAVREGRRREFARFARFADPAARAAIPDPNTAAAFRASKLDWACLERDPHRDWLAFHRALLALRARELAPRLHGTRALGARVLGAGALHAAWRLGDGATLSLFLHLGTEAVAGVALPSAEPWFAWPEEAAAADRLPPDSALWFLETKP
jgi:maltooligosyltrehalose trehalohydrolase